MILNPSTTIKLNSVIAAELLENGVKNRPINSATVKQYQRDMETGKFGVSQIMVNSEGNLTSGFHRMTALSKLPEEIYIEFTMVIDDDPMARIRANEAKTGNAKDEAARNSVPNAKDRMSISRRLLALEAKIHGVGAANPSNEDIYTRGTTEPLMDDVITIFNGLQSAFGIPAGAVAPFIIFASVNKEKTFEYYDSLSTGLNLSKGSPILSASRALSAIPRGSKGLSGSAMLNLSTYYILRGFKQFLLDQEGPGKYTSPEKFGEPENVSECKKIIRILENL